jgi:hypothetical protein
MKRIFISLGIVFSVFSCTDKKQNTDAADLNGLAEKYVRLGLAIGQYDADFVDAYYGPDSLKPTGPKATVFPKDSLLKAAATLKASLSTVANSSTNDTLRNRANWIASQLTAFERRIKIFSGELAGFDEESADLFGTKAPVNTEDYFKGLVAQLNTGMPGSGPLDKRFQLLTKKFTIPKNKVDTVFKTAIAEARKRTLAHYPLPSTEAFTLEYVTNKPWSGYNWYKGHYNSVIQINVDQPILIDRAIDLACHEGYPGHHVYNMLLEKNLYRDKGWLEICIYPLFSPQSLIAEGSANYGIQVAFPGDEQKAFCKSTLLPLAGLDTTGIDAYFTALALKGQLNYARNEVARGLLNKSMTEADAVRWLTSYALMSEEGAKKSISFINKYRSYVLNYNYGQTLVKQYIEAGGGTANNPAKRWELFGWLLSNQVTPSDLAKDKK